MAKLQNHKRKLKKNALQLKKLAEQVPKSKYATHQEQELELFEEIDVKDEQIIPKEEVITKVQEQVDNVQVKWQDEHDELVQVDLSKVARLRKLIKSDGQDMVSGQEYQNRLRQFYNDKVQSSNFLSWTQSKVDQKQEQDIEESMPLEAALTQNVHHSMHKNDVLQSSMLSIEKAGLTNKQNKGDCVVQSISFHPKLPIFVTGGYDKVLRVYQIHPKKQLELKKTIVLDKFPINRVQFTNSGTNVIVSSPYNTFLLDVNIITNQTQQFQSTLITRHFTQLGRYNKQIGFALSDDDSHIVIFNDTGYLHILDGKTHQFMFEFKQNEACSAAVFSDNYLYSAGKGGKIYQWSLVDRRVANIMHNPGGFEVNSMDFRNDLLAVGCKTGIVNIFKFDPITQKCHKLPIKEIQNLTTSVDSVHFNQFGDFLCIASKWKDDAIRIVHVDSMTVFQNWPTLKANLKKVNAIGISKDSRFLVTGNENGDLKVFRLLHY